MTRPSSSPRRFAAMALVVLGALLGLMVCSGVSAAETRPAPPVTVVDHHQVPGCGKSAPDGGGARPATPPRAGSSAELLPALHDTRGAAGAWGADAPIRSLLPGHESPELVPPSPVDLSILRV
ncbi:hypothetical protein ACH44C_11520 [Streptomyces purpureus]|uniref:hypothetical protein n=1 Tax=Streptomyces purpureus TaxID=1951 RepID=UPI00131A4469|nr:hypothetical protein [Streptomyces purpureus]